MGRTFARSADANHCSRISRFFVACPYYQYHTVTSQYFHLPALQNSLPCRSQHTIPCGEVQSEYDRAFASNEPQRPAYYQKLVNDVVEHMALLLSRGTPRLDGYLRVILNTNKASSGLVKLVHKTRQFTQTSLMRQLVYEKTSDTPHLLSSDMVAAQSMMRAEAAAFVPRMQRPKDGVEIRPAEKENLNPVRSRRRIERK
ncbi:uncharacterized protein F5891DRAFT_33113 [Suillus fuscotomentosus]|uniref:Uncharacterized protein n=1 Tax=Suillus fuscotomentosus TaxID=1912939 RepID=A0AAD4EFS0_9AGAM|nr:uncharacterized protein F5891DRAFT_33113 [Suillus fuscotomentosus]KAG1904143.1 hypothetical protein F5891DRAFT_33113 [Suillus fuscotomentosus]